MNKLIVIAALAVLGGTPSIAHAQAAPSLATALQGEARTDYDNAKDLFGVGDYASAELKFKHAFELSNDPRLLWNIAVCEKEQKHYARSVTYVERYLREAAVPPETRANAQGTLEALRSLYSRASLVGPPDGAKVSVDGEEIGTTPLPGTLPLDIGTHTIRLEHPDHEPLDLPTGTVTGGGEMSFEAKMKELRDGHLTIAASGRDTIAIDGKVVGSGEWEGGLAPGRHQLRVTAIGKQPYVATVDIAPRANRSVQVTLVDEKHRTIWPWILGSAAVVAGATVGGYFLFRPDDKPGPYQSGGLGTVFLPTGH